MDQTIVAFFMSRREAQEAVEELRRRDWVTEAHFMENMDIEAQLSNRLWDSQMTVGDISEESGGINLVLRAPKNLAGETASALLELGARRAEIY
ncbi:MAG: hypothetical protein ACM3ZA_13595 [Bacillota bacterium]